MKSNGIRRVIVPAAVLLSCAGLLAVLVFMEDGKRPALGDSDAETFAVAGAPAAPDKPQMPVASMDDGAIHGDSRANADPGNDVVIDGRPPIRVTASREDIQQFILLFTARDPSPPDSGMKGAQAGAGVTRVSRDAAVMSEPVAMSAPQRVYMASANEAELRQHIADASQRVEREEDPNVRAAALGDLAAIGEPAVLPVIGEALSDADIHVRHAAMDALQRIARHRGDDSGEIARWVENFAGDEDTDLARMARTVANELAENRGEEPPYL